MAAAGPLLVLDAQALSLLADDHADTVSLVEALDGHANLIDALVTATAASTNAPGRLLTADSSHIPVLYKAAVELGARQIKYIVV